MLSKVRTGSRFVSFAFALSMATIASIGWSGCSGSSSGFSGRYSADMGGGSVNLDFEGSNKVNVSLVSPDGKDTLTHHCVYTISENRMVITTDEPMGVPMSLIVDGGTLKDGSGVVYKKK
jgi:hypothetical protein